MTHIRKFYASIRQPAHGVNQILATVLIIKELKSRYPHAPSHAMRVAQAIVNIERAR